MKISHILTLTLIIPLTLTGIQPPTQAIHRVPLNQVQARRKSYVLSLSPNPQTVNVTLNRRASSTEYRSGAAVADYGWHIESAIGFSVKPISHETTSIEIQIWLRNITSIYLFHFSYIIIHKQLWQIIPSLWIQTTQILYQAGRIFPYTKANFTPNVVSLVQFNLVCMFYSQDPSQQQNALIIENGISNYNETHYIIRFRVDDNAMNVSISFLIITIDNYQFQPASIELQFQNVLVNPVGNYDFNTQKGTNCFFGNQRFQFTNCKGDLTLKYSYQGSNKINIKVETEFGSARFNVLFFTFNRLLECPVPLVKSPITQKCQECPTQYTYNQSSYSCYECPSKCQSCQIIDQQFKCLSCQKGMTLTPLGTCCTPLLGCTQVICNHYEDSHCLLCDFSGNFESDQQRCKCMTGYYFETDTQECYSICGDGYKIDSQECDNGDVGSGYGCSDSCQIQSGFTCSTNQNSLSKCFLTNTIEIEYKLATKSKTANQATLQFTMKPYQKWLDETEIKDFEITPGIFNDYLIQKKMNKIKIIGSFNQTMQNHTFNCTFYLDSMVIEENRSTLSLNFTVIGSNQPIQYITELQETSSFQVMKLIVIFILVNLLILFILSLIVHRVIGCEGILSAQTSYFCQIIICQITVKNSFRMLKYMNGYINFPIIDQKSTIFQSFVLIGFDSHYGINNTLIGAIFVFLSSFIVIVYKFRLVWAQDNLISVILEQKSTKAQIDQAVQNWQNLQNRYLNVLFRYLQPCCMCFMLIYVWSVQINFIYRTITPPQIGFRHILNLIICTFGYFIILFMIWVQLATQRAIFLKTPKLISKHFPILLLFKVHFIVIVFATHLDFPMYTNYIMMVIQISYIGYIIIIRPYQNHLHNIGLFINQLPTIFVLIFSFYVKNNTKVEKEWIRLFQAVYIGLLMLLIVYSYVRILVHWCSGDRFKLVIKGKKGKEQDVIQTDKKEENVKNDSHTQSKLRTNPYLLRNILYQDKLKEYDAINKQRKKHGFCQLIPPKQPTHRKETNPLKKATQKDKKQERMLRAKLTRKNR